LPQETRSDVSTSVMLIIAAVHFFDIAVTSFFDEFCQAGFTCPR
jgi:hypothetical protein